MFNIQHPADIMPLIPALGHLNQVTCSVPLAHREQVQEVQGQVSMV